MDAREYIRRQFAALRRLQDGVMQGTTDEQFNWSPPGMANPIRVAFVHLVSGEDAFIGAIDPALILETVRSGVCGIGRGDRVLKV